jgi:hypothetical protein
MHTPVVLWRKLTPQSHSFHLCDEGEWVTGGGWPIGVYVRLLLPLNTLIMDMPPINAAVISVFFSAD